VAGYAEMQREMQSMTEDDHGQKLDELDRLLNDPAVPMQPTLIWQLLGEVSKHETKTPRLATLDPAGV
jgi:hypothetical protein